MKLEKGVISSSQLLFLVVAFIQGAHLTVSFIAGITKHDSWLAVLAAFLISLFFVNIYVTLAQKFPGKNLMQINDMVYGVYIGKFISLLYILFFLSVAANNLILAGRFFTTYIMPETPISVILMMLMFVCAWAVRGGIEVLARCSFILMAITFLMFITITVLQIKDVQLTNFLPVFEVSLMDFIQGTHIIVAIPFCEIIVFLMFIPYMNNIKQAKASVLWGLTLGALQFFIIAVRDISVLGPLSTITESPAFQATRLIDIAHIITRLDVFIALILLNTMFMKISIFFYALVLGTAQLFNLRSYKSQVIPIGIMIIIFAFLFYASSVRYNYVASKIWPIVSIPFEVIIPLLSLLIAQIKGYPKKVRGECK